MSQGCQGRTEFGCTGWEILQFLVSSKSVQSLKVEHRKYVPLLIFHLKRVEHRKYVPLLNSYLKQDCWQGTERRSIIGNLVTVRFSLNISSISPKKRVFY